VELAEIVMEEAAPDAVEREVIDVQVEEATVPAVEPTERVVAGADIITDPVAKVEVEFAENTKEEGIL
jgi:hypothetical protein